jgi:hypothetical protein
MIETQNKQVRLFEATLPNGERALLKEFPPQAADLASNEAAMHKQVRENS